MRMFILWLALMIAVPTVSFATKIKDIDISPKNPKVGDTVKISVKTSGDVAKAEIEFTDLNVTRDLAASGKNTWGISVPVNNTGEKKFKVHLYKNKKDKSPKDTEKDKFVVSAKNEPAKPAPVPAPVKQNPAPVVQVPQQQNGSVKVVAVKSDSCSDEIKDTLQRTGCRVGDTKCWLQKGGYCTDYIQKKTGHRQSGNANKWASSKIKSNDIKKGDVAIFKSKTHVAYVENVNKNNTVDISEFNYGPCWVDKDNIVSNKYGVPTYRTVDISNVDGGFWRP